MIGRRTIRFRLRMLDLALVLLVLVSLSAGQYLLLDHILHMQARESLQDQTQPTIDRALNGPRGAPNLELGEAANRLATDLSSANSSALVLDSAGRVLGRPTGDSAAALPPLPAPDAARVARVVAASAPSSYTTSANGAHLLVLLLPIRGRQSGAPLLGVAQVASPLTSIDATLRTLLLIDALSITLGVAVVALLAPAVASVSLLPLRRMIVTAERLGEGDLSQRVLLPQGNDEVGQLAEALNQMAERLETLFSTQRQFVSDASHELRTPLTVVRSSIELLLLQVEADPARVPELLRSAHRELARMSRLVADLLELARIDAGVRLQLQPIDLASVARRLADDVRDLTADHVVALECGDHPLVRADARRVSQVLRNFLDNARAFTPPGGRITLRTGADEHEGWVEVQDSGPGIDEQHLALIFDRFYRVETSRSRDRGGAGLGLAIARSLAEAQHGRVEVVSTAGCGASFRLVLPRSFGEEQQSPAGPLAPDEGGRPTA